MARLDPQQRAREYRQRHRDDSWTRTEKQKLKQLERKADRAERLASQPDQTSPMEVVDALPDPTSDYLGRSLVLRTPGGFRSSVNTAIQLADDTVVWQEMAQVQAAAPPAGTAFSFVRAISSLGSGSGNLFHPRGVDYTDDGDVWVCDTGNHRLKKFSPTGTLLVNTGGVGSGNGQFASGAPSYPNYNNPAPKYVSLERTGQTPWVTDHFNKRVTAFTDAGAYASKVNEADVPVVFSSIYGIRWDPVVGFFYVVDYVFHEVMMFSNTFSFVLGFGSYGAGAGQFNNPVDVATDSSGNIFVVETSNHRVQKFNASRAYVTHWGGPTAGNVEGMFNAPKGIFVDASNRVFVADTGNHRVQIFDNNGSFIQSVGDAGTMSEPQGVCVTPAATAVMFVSDASYHQITVWSE